MFSTARSEGGGRLKTDRGKSEHVPSIPGVQEPAGAKKRKKESWKKEKGEVS